jgi:peptidoglycan hydrolase-like protein with peptidoglycan-binding domain
VSLSRANCTDAYSGSQRCSVGATASDLAERDDAFVGIAKRALTGASVTPSSNKNSIKSLQWLLTARGHTATADGEWGALTTAAIKTFQKAKGLVQDGEAGPTTLGALVSEVRVGSTGSFVKAAQTALSTFGANLLANGDFGAGTKTAAINFQKSKGLT